MIRRPKPKTDAEKIKDLEIRVRALETELRAVRERLLQELARALHGPSQPPPPFMNNQ